MFEIPNGVYPTMITPYKNKEIDFDAVAELVDFYVKNGCSGVFAVCQSSEMQFLSLKERVRLAKAVVDASNGRLKVVASGHCADSIEAQAEEMDRISETGIDAFVWVSNRLDMHNDGDAIWIENAEKLLEKSLNKSIPLGIYECPKPYKRLLTTEIFKWCLTKKRFAFIKDTCCDPELLSERLGLLRGTTLKLFNANGQTCLHSLKQGASGYSGIMANFHPDLYVWLCQNFKAYPEKAEVLSNALSMMAFTENPAYPYTAKYYLNQYAVVMDAYARSCDEKQLTKYQKLCVTQMHDLCEIIRKDFLKEY